MSREAIENLQRLGYTPDEAGFLYLAAVHSGYFVRRQFSEFLCQPRGGTAARLVEKLVQNRHAEVSNFRSNRLIYHIRAKQIYSRLGQTDNRNRREKAPLTIKRKLMCLDFVLAHREERYLATESEKVSYFAGERGIPFDALPMRHYESYVSREFTDRYFVDKLPIYVSADGPSLSPPVVHFAYVDEGAETLDGLETFLHQYHLLFAALGAFELAYVANESRSLDKAQRLFRKFYPESGGAARPEEHRMLRFFQMRRKFEARDFSGLDTKQIIDYREEKAQFSSTEHEALYRRWLAEGGAAVSLANGTRRDFSASFGTVVLNQAYDFFGGLRCAS